MNGVATQLRAQVEPGAPRARQADVEDDDVVVAGLRLRVPVGESGCDRGVDAVLAEAVLQQSGQLGVVFDNQHPHLAKMRERVTPAPEGGFLR